jgi:hypothetical protein
VNLVGNWVEKKVEPMDDELVEKLADYLVDYLAGDLENKMVEQTAVMWFGKLATQKELN